MRAVVLRVWKAPRVPEVASLGDELAREGKEREEMSEKRAGIFWKAANSGGGLGPS